MSQTEWSQSVNRRHREGKQITLLQNTSGKVQKFSCSSLKKHSQLELLLNQTCRLARRTFLKCWGYANKDLHAILQSYPNCTFYSKLEKSDVDDERWWAVRPPSIMAILMSGVMKRRLICVIFNMSQCSCFTHHLWTLTLWLKCLRKKQTQSWNIWFCLTSLQGKGSHYDNTRKKDFMMCFMSWCCKWSDLEALHFPRAVYASALALVFELSRLRLWVFAQHKRFTAQIKI